MEGFLITGTIVHVVALHCNPQYSSHMHGLVYDPHQIYNCLDLYHHASLNGILHIFYATVSHLVQSQATNW